MPQAVTVRRIKKVDRLVGGHVVEPRRGVPSGVSRDPEAGLPE
jgi:hypothetical protein